MGLLDDAKRTVSDASSSVSTAVSDAAADAATLARAADLNLRTVGEATALSGLFFPTSFIAWYQTQRAALGFQPPTIGQIPILIIVIPMVITIIIGIVYSQIMATGDIAIKAASGKKTSQFQNIFFIFMCFIIFTAVIIAVFFWFGPGTEVVNNLTTQTAIGTVAGFQNAAEPASEESYKLVNIQPLAIKQTGFVGPTEIDGSFDPALGIQTAVRSGVSFFTLQIDYLERAQDPKSFDAINIPTLLYRDSSGKLISKNGGSIKETAKQLANYLFSPDLGASTYPVILYLHFVKTPDPVKKPTEYLNFLKKVSEALQPLHPYFLKDSGENFRRQRSEGSLLQLPLTGISNTIILMSNADTTIFRNSQVTGKTLSPISDLDSFINMRVYLDSGSDTMGVTQPVADAKASAVLVSYSRLKNMSAADRAIFAGKGKSRFVIAMPSQLENPTYAELKTILKDTGVNAIPLNLIGPDPAPINKIISLWATSRPYYMLKQMMLQSYKTGVTPNGP